MARTRKVSSGKQQWRLYGPPRPPRRETVEAVTWWDFGGPSFFARGGMVHAGLRPKEGYRRLKALLDAGGGADVGGDVGPAEFDVRQWTALAADRVVETRGFRSASADRESPDDGRKLSD